MASSDQASRTREENNSIKTRDKEPIAAFDKEVKKPKTCFNWLLLPKTCGF